MIPKLKTIFFLNEINQAIVNEKINEGLKQIKDIIKSLKEKILNVDLNLEIKENNFEINIINEILNELYEEEDKRIKIDDLDEIIIFIYYYTKFKNKKSKIIPPISNENKEIINYYTIENMKKSQNYNINIYLYYHKDNYIYKNIKGVLHNYQNL